MKKQKSKTKQKQNKNILNKNKLTSKQTSDQISKRANRQTHKQTKTNKRAKNQDTRTARARASTARLPAARNFVAACGMSRRSVKRDEVPTAAYMVVILSSMHNISCGATADP